MGGGFQARTSHRLVVRQSVGLGERGSDKKHFFPLNFQHRTEVQEVILFGAAQNKQTNTSFNGDKRK